MLTKPAIEEREHNSERYAGNIRTPILHIGTAPEGGLDKFYETAEGAGSHKDEDQSKAASTCQWKGESGKGNEVHKFVDAIWRWGRLIDRPKHGHCQ